LGYKTAAGTTYQFQSVGQKVCKRFRLRARQGNVDQCRDHSHQGPLQNETGFDLPAHSERSQEAGDEGPRGSSVVQEIVAETQTRRNNREDESHFCE